MFKKDLSFYRLATVYSSLPNTLPLTTLEREPACHVHIEENQTYAKEGTRLCTGLLIVNVHYNRLNLDSSRPLKGRLAHLCKQLYISAST